MFYLPFCIPTNISPYVFETAIRFVLFSLKISKLIASLSGKISILECSLNLIYLNNKIYD